MLLSLALWPTASAVEVNSLLELNYFFDSNS